MKKGTHTPGRDAPASELAACYTYNVTWSWEEQCYVASVAGWPGLSAEAPTVKDALRQITGLVQASVENFRTLGLDFPLPAEPSGVAPPLRKVHAATDAARENAGV